MKNKFSLLLIGLGNIGYKYDLNLPNQYVWSHFRAFENHPNFEIKGVVDINKKEIENFSRQFNVNSYHSIEKALISQKPDLIVVSTPNETHLETLKKVFNIFSPKYIVCEKPLGNSFDQSIEIIELCKKNNSLLFVNYQRNSSTLSHKIKEKIVSHEFKPPYKIVVWYSKGLDNSASHFITLFNFFFGKIKNVDSINSSTNNKILNNQEPFFKLNYDNCEALFVPVSDINYFYNSFDMICKNGKLTYQNGGEFSSWYKVDNQNKTYSNHNILTNEKEKFNSDFNYSQLSYVNNLSLYLEGKKNSISTSEDALETINIIRSIRNQLNEIK